MQVYNLSSRYPVTPYYHTWYVLLNKNKASSRINYSLSHGTPVQVSTVHCRILRSVRLFKLARHSAIPRASRDRSLNILGPLFPMTDHDTRLLRTLQAQFVGKDISKTHDDRFKRTTIHSEEAHAVNSASISAHQACAQIRD